MNTFISQALKNWQPTLAAAIVAVAQVGGQIGIPPKIVNWATIIAIVFGLMSAKQQSVTGGTTFQGDSIEVAKQKAVQTVETLGAMPSAQEKSSISMSTPRPSA